MRNIQKVLIGIFLTGVLLTGVGTGMALGEFSSLSYGGKKIIGEEDLVTKEMDFEIPMDDKTVILAYQGYRERWKGSLIEDTSVPEGTIRFQVTYNEKVVEPYLHYREYEEEEMTEKEQEEMSDTKAEDIIIGELYLTYDYKGNEFELFMENKNKILEDLKQKSLSSYEIPHIIEVTVRVNPGTKSCVRDNLFRY